MFFLQISTLTMNPIEVSVSYVTHPCGGVITDQNGYIQSPKIEASSQNIECAWQMKLPDGERINLTMIEMDLGEDCDKSFFVIYNGQFPTAPRIDKYCRSNKPQNSIISESNYLWMEYKWEKGSTGKAIKIKYEPYGGGNLSSSKLDTLL